MNDRASPEKSDVNRLFDAITAMGREMNALNTAFQVYAANNDARLKVVETTAAQHQEKFNDLERLKNKGILYALLAMAVSGTFGGGVAHLARKFLE